MRIRKRKMIFALAAAAVTYTMTEEAKARAKEPKFRVLSRHGNCEIRLYPKIVVARVRVDGDRGSALNEGFRILAAYIFGKNKPAGREDEASETHSLSTASAKSKGQKIDMVAPVTIELEGRRWLITFIMPEQFAENIATLPAPIDNRIEITQIEERKLATIKFAGSASERQFTKKRDELLKLIGGMGMSAAGQSIHAYYNPPFALPFLKRNEVLIPITG
ncbi:MAG: heme-binding protein [Candidatus Obscuribacterales bacterium]|jgi:hypothetical protein|nr:heme-binding protein [Candidatus Obscuribacterales bacterium]